MNATDEIILDTSERAAAIKTLTGWVDRYGHFWGEDERTARYSGATHRECESCGGIYRKNAWCEPCHKVKRDAIFAAMPRQPWDGETPLVIFDSDQYFFDQGQLTDYCEDNGISPESLPLVICEPQYVSPFEISDHCQDIIPEDGDEYSVPDAIREAAEKLNEAIKDAKEPVSWAQGKVAAALKTPEAGRGDSIVTKAQASVLTKRF